MHVCCNIVLVSLVTEPSRASPMHILYAAVPIPIRTVRAPFALVVFGLFFVSIPLVPPSRWNNVLCCCCCCRLCYAPFCMCICIYSIFIIHCTYVHMHICVYINVCKFINMYLHAMSCIFVNVCCAIAVASCNIYVHMCERSFQSI